MKRELTGADVARMAFFAGVTIVLMAFGASYWVALLAVLGLAFAMAAYSAHREYRREQDEKPFGPDIERIP